MTEPYVAALAILLRLARLLGVVRRHLEADPRPERAEQRDAGRGGAEGLQRGLVVEDLGRVQRRGAVAVRAAAVDEDPDAQHQQREHLGTSATPSTFAVSSMWNQAKPDISASAPNM